MTAHLLPPHFLISESSALFPPSINLLSEMGWFQLGSAVQPSQELFLPVPTVIAASIHLPNGTHPVRGGSPSGAWHAAAPWQEQGMSLRSCCESRGAAGLCLTVLLCAGVTGTGFSSSEHLAVHPVRGEARHRSSFLQFTSAVLDPTIPMAGVSPCTQRPFPVRRPPGMG